MSVSKRIYMSNDQMFTCKTQHMSLTSDTIIIPHIVYTFALYLDGATGKEDILSQPILFSP